MPYIIILNDKNERLIVYMDSTSYQKTEVWKYIYEDLVQSQRYVLFEAKGAWLGENAYWLTELNQVAVLEDKSRAQRISKFAMDAYRK